MSSHQRPGVTKASIADLAVACTPAPDGTAGNRAQRRREARSLESIETEGRRLVDQVKAAYRGACGTEDRAERAGYVAIARVALGHLLSIPPRVPQFRLDGGEQALAAIAALERSPPCADRPA